MSIETLLKDEIRDELEKLGKMKVGDEEYKVTVDGLVKLVDRVNEIEKIRIEKEDKIENREIETRLKIQQMEDEKRSRFIGNCINVAGIVIPVIVTIWGTAKSFEFEKEGTITTIMGRGFIQKLLPRK